MRLGTTRRTICLPRARLLAVPSHTTWMGQRTSRLSPSTRSSHTRPVKARDSPSLSSTPPKLSNSTTDGARTRMAVIFLTHSASSLLPPCTAGSCPVARLTSASVHKVAPVPASGLENRKKGVGAAIRARTNSVISAAIAARRCYRTRNNPRNPRTAGHGCPTSTPEVQRQPSPKTSLGPPSMTSLMPTNTTTTSPSPRLAVTYCVIGTRNPLEL